MNIYQRINAVQQKIKYVQKDKAVSTGSGSYMAVTHDQVTAMVRPLLVEFGIVVVPKLIKSVMNTAVVDAQMNIAKQRLYEATYEFTFINIEQADDCFTVVIEAHAFDNGDKAPGKALSYAKKYAVLKVFEIETGENEESRSVVGLDDERIEYWILKINSLEGEEKKAAYKEATNECNRFHDVESHNRIKAGVAK